MAGDATSHRANALAARLEAAADALIVAIGNVDHAAWSAVPVPGVWSIGKDAAHVVEATAMHQWIVGRTIGRAVPSRRPPIERAEPTTARSPEETAKLLRKLTHEGVVLVRGLTDEQLDLPTRPPRAGGRQRLAETIERVLIRHYDVHRAEIEAKLQRG